MNIGIVGYGTMGRIYADRLSKMEGVRVSALCPSSKGKALEPAEAAEAEVYESYGQMLKTANLDVVCVTLPSYLHREHVISALEAGKHVICEKPLALSLEDSLDIARKCGSTGKRVLVAHVARFFPEYETIRTRLLAGDAGAAQSVYARRVSLMPREGSWFRDADKSGGVVFDLMIHDIDYVMWLFGSAIAEVGAEWVASDGVKSVRAILRYEDGKRAVIEAGWGARAFQTELKLFGSRAVLELEGKAKRREENARQAADGVVIPESNDSNDPYDKQLGHFVEAIRTGGPSRVTIEEAAAAVGVAERIVRLLN